MRKDFGEKRMECMYNIKCYSWGQIDAGLRGHPKPITPKLPHLRLDKWVRSSSLDYNCLSGNSAFTQHIVIIGSFNSSFLV